MKKMFAVLLSLLVIWSMAACGAQSAAPETAAQSQVTEQEMLSKTTEPEQTEPEVTEPEATAPETVTPEVTEPEATVPEVTEPEETAPEVTAPEEIQPETVTPEVTEPEATVPEVTEPEQTPEVTVPEATVPEVTEPEETTPEGTEPEETVPETKPETTTPPEPQHSHSYTKTVIAPTCEESGYTLNTCSCGDSYKSDEKDPSGHSFGQWMVTKEPTTSETGLEERECKTCGEKQEKTTEKLVQVHTHDYVGKITAEPTCSASGVQKYVCECGEAYEETVAPLPHDDIVTEVISCYEPSYWVYTCKICGDVRMEYMYIPIRHNYVDIITDPTCTEDGSKATTCTKCGEVNWVDILKAPGHIWQHSGCQTYNICTVCGEQGEFYHHSWRGTPFRCEDCGVTVCEYWGHIFIEGREKCWNQGCGVYTPEIVQMVETILDQIITDGMSEFQKVKAIHDYICKNAEYDWGNYVGGTIPDTSYNVTGFLEYGVIVCDGYAKTFKLLCNSAGIECERVTGWGAGGRHAWNQVQIDGKWYNVDVCWDDEDDIMYPIEYVYFLLSDEQFYKSHLAEDAQHVCEETYPEDGFRRMFYYY